MKNYMKKANVYGYRGDRENFKKLETELSNAPENFLIQLFHLNVFKSVKSILDAKPSVTNELY